MKACEGQPEALAMAHKLGLRVSASRTDLAGTCGSPEAFEEDTYVPAPSRGTSPSSSADVSTSFFIRELHRMSSLGRHSTTSGLSNISSEFPSLEDLARKAAQSDRGKATEDGFTTLDKAQAKPVQNLVMLSARRSSAPAIPDLDSQITEDFSSEGGSRRRRRGDLLEDSFSHSRRRLGAAIGDQHTSDAASAVANGSSGLPRDKPAETLDQGNEAVGSGAATQGEAQKENAATLFTQFLHRRSHVHRENLDTGEIAWRSLPVGSQSLESPRTAQIDKTDSAQVKELQAALQLLRHEQALLLRQLRAADLQHNADASRISALEQQVKATRAQAGSWRKLYLESLPKQ